MRFATSRPSCLALAALAFAVCAYEPRGAVGATPPASASASAGALAGAGTQGIPVSAYTWPTEVSPEPREEEWAGALELSSVRVDIVPRFSWLPTVHDVVCTQHAVGAWLRVTCTPRHDGKEDVLVGSLWGLAGDVAKVKGSFALASELERYKAPPTGEFETALRKMGASATITLPLAPGSALLLRLDRIEWDSGYESSSVGIEPGILIDVSWAVGEKAPTILYR
jgi:hypothetical protein